MPIEHICQMSICQYDILNTMTDEIIQKTIKHMKEKKLVQTDISELTGITQGEISRMLYRKKKKQSGEMDKTTRSVRPKTHSS